MAYVDGFVLPVPKKNLAAYRAMARKAGRVWMEHGALEYREFVGEDLGTKMGLPFTRLARAKRGETVVFSWIVYASRAARDRINAKVMKDPRLTSMPGGMPFDVKRMSYGGFKPLVDLPRTAATRRGGRRAARAPARPRQGSAPAEPPPLHEEPAVPLI